MARRALLCGRGDGISERKLLCSAVPINIKRGNIMIKTVQFGNTVENVYPMSVVEGIKEV